DEEIIFGKNPVLEALRSGRAVHKVLLAKQINKGLEQEVQRGAKRARATVQVVSNEQLNELARGGSHQGVVAFVAPYEYASIDDLFGRAEEKGEEPFFIVLDELEDPHNLGAIFRTADAAGVHGVIIP